MTDQPEVECLRKAVDQYEKAIAEMNQGRAERAAPYLDEARKWASRHGNPEARRGEGVLNQIENDVPVKSDGP